MTPIFKYYQFPAAMWQGKESAWDMGVLQSDSEYRKTMVRSTRQIVARVFLTAHSGTD